MKSVRAFSISGNYRLRIFALVLCVGTPSLFSQAVSLPSQPEASSAFLWKSDHAEHLIGLSEIKPKINGTLALSPNEFIFTTPNGQTSLQRAQITSVSIGDERRETGGKVGKFARMAIPNGGGMAVAMVTHAKVDLLTIEYHDGNHAYHGAVFLLPKNEATQLRDMFPTSESQNSALEPHSPCLPGSTQPKTLKLSAINVEGLPLPTEYKVLLYEQLLRRLQLEAGFEHVFRDDDQSSAAACPAVNLMLTVNAFSKGNAVLRASSGPLGLFLGATSLSFHVRAQDDQDKVVFEKDLKASQRGDTESLDIADRIAKTVTKKLKKLP